jgi:hypothetical protein
VFPGACRQYLSGTTGVCIIYHISDVCTIHVHKENTSAWFSPAALRAEERSKGKYHDFLHIGSRAHPSNGLLRMGRTAAARET